MLKFKHESLTIVVVAQPGKTGDTDPPIPEQADPPIPEQADPPIPEHVDHLKKSDLS